MEEALDDITFLVALLEKAKDNPQALNLENRVRLTKINNQVSKLIPILIELRPWML